MCFSFSNRKGWTPIFCAAANGHAEALKVLLKQDFHPNDLDKADRNKETAMHIASKAGHEKVVRALIRNGASVKVLNAMGMNALDLAISYGHR